MKIGILTHHYVKNFGAYMQADALIQVLKAMYPESEVQLVDYRVRKHEIMNCVHFFGFKPKRGDTWRGLAEKIGLFFTHSKYERRLPKSPRVHNAEEIDRLNDRIIIVGADEVWNFRDMAYAPVKFGIGINTPVISYSASAGGSSAEGGVPEEILNGIKRFKAVAVRDKYTEKLAAQAGGKHPVRTLDPVFLWDYELKVRRKIREAAKNPYLLIYDCRLPETQIRPICEYAKKNHLNILGAGEYREWYTTAATVNVTPYEWAYLFQKADGIITGTFHGVSFSIKYKRRFAAYLTEQNRINKVGSLLEEFGLSSHAVKKGEENHILPILADEIDYHAVGRIAEAKKAASLQYLRSSIEAVCAGQQNGSRISDEVRG